MMTSLFTGVTGLKSHSVGMSSISNNIANVNTLAFKNAMLLYSDHTSTSVSSASGNGVTEMSQLGLGVAVQVNRTMHQEGAFSQGSSPTDLAIAGKGYFGLEKDGTVQYGRAGNFRFTQAGDLVDPNGWGLLGYEIDNGVQSATATPIKMNFSETGKGYMSPKATSSVTLIENLGSKETYAKDEANPFFSLASSWDGEQTPPLASGKYGHSNKIGVYDASGQLQDIETYYDFVGTFNGKSVYQYVLGVDPAVDGTANAGTQASGMLAAGTITFSSSGQMEDMTMFLPPEGGDSTDFSTWLPASFDASGNPMLTANFLDAEGAPQGSQNISIDYGLKINGAWRGEYANAAEAAADPAALYSGPGRERASQSSTSHAGSSGTIVSKQDGYAPGQLQDMTIDDQGYMSGRYSNGETDQLYRIPIYRFINEEGLQHEGGNRYTASTESGAAEEGFPTEENYGSMLEATLEESNVDLAREFTSMIMTQRGFQMNSKVVSTSDQMLQKALELKR